MKYKLTQNICDSCHTNTLVKDDYFNKNSLKLEILDSTFKNKLIVFQVGLEDSN